MTEERSTGDPLRRAMAGARLRDIDVATRLQVDPKTVQRWMAGRVPQARHRWAVAELLKTHEFDLWPQLAGVPAIDPEVYAAYPNRASVPREVWRNLFEGAEREIGILVYSGLFLAEDADLMRTLEQKARGGVSVRILLGDPESAHVQRRGEEEGIHGAMAAKIRNALVLYSPLEAAGAEIRLHPTVLYNSIYQADDQMLVNQHVYGLAAAYAPALHLRPNGETANSLYSLYRSSFEQIWSAVTPATQDASV